MSPILLATFHFHDFLVSVFSKHLVRIKTMLLLLAHLVIFGFFFPELRKFFGEQALNVLFFLLFLSPLAKILRMQLLVILMSYRRQLGILMAYLATVHGIGFLTDPLWFQETIGQSLWQADPRYVAGITAYVLTLPLLFTSNTLATKLLGKNWKRLHSLVYLVFILAVLHKFTIGKGFSDTASVIQAVLVLLFYFLLKWWAYHGLPTFLETQRLAIASQYWEYRKTLQAEKNDTQI